MTDFQGAKAFQVTVRVAGKPDFAVTLRADREGLATTRAMVVYPYQLRGEVVDYIVTEA